MSENLDSGLNVMQRMRKPSEGAVPLDITRPGANRDNPAPTPLNPGISPGGRKPSEGAKPA